MMMLEVELVVVFALKIGVLFEQAVNKNSQKTQQRISVYQYVAAKLSA